MKHLKVNDFYRLSFLSSMAYDGENLYFVVSRPLKKKNDYASKIYTYNKKIMEFTAGQKENAPRVSPDGKYLAFIASRKKNKAVMLKPLKGGRARVLVEKDEINSIKWAYDSKSIYFISNDSEKTRDDIKIIKNYPFYFNNKGFIYNKRPALFNVDMEGRESKLTGAPYNLESYDVSANSQIALVMHFDGQELEWNNIYIMTAQKLQKFEKEGTFSYPEFSPDGKYLAITYSDNQKSLNQHAKLHLLNIENLDFECVSCSLDRSIGNSINSDSRLGAGSPVKWSRNEIYFSVTDHGATILYSYSLKDRTINKVLSDKASIDEFYVTDRKIFIIAQRANMPQELYVFDKSIRKLSNFNGYFHNLPEPENFRYTASDGEEVEGWFLSYENIRLPTILEIHGGPKTAYGHAFIFEMHLLASSGFNVLFLNPRGSDGYSDEFSLKIKEHFGERDYEDIIEGMEFAAARYPINRDKLGVTGGSYGGFMTNWIVGHTDMFKAAVTLRSITNQTSFFGTSDIGPSFNQDQIGGTVFDNFGHYWDKSPLKYARTIKTPLLIIHSDEDYRCPIEQAYQLYTALKFLKKDAELAIFPGENHELSRSGKPRHRIKRLELILDWFSKYLLI